MIGALAAALWTGVAAPAAHADGLFLIYGDRVPEFGCEVTYSIDDTTQAGYGEYLIHSLPQITAYTGIKFTEVASEYDADIKYKTVDSLDQYDDEAGADAIGITFPDTGEILLLPVEKITGLPWSGNQGSKIARINLVTHETLHAMGLDHDQTSTNEDEIMAPMIKYDSTDFGSGDRQGLEFIRNANGCSTSGIAAPPVLTDGGMPGTTLLAAVVTGLVALVAMVMGVVYLQRRPATWVRPAAPPMYPPPPTFPPAAYGQPTPYGYATPPPPPPMYPPGPPQGTPPTPYGYPVPPPPPPAPPPPPPMYPPGPPLQSGP